MRVRAVVLLLAFSMFGSARGADIVWVHQGRGGGNGVDNTAAGEGTLTWEDDAWRQLIESWGHNIVTHAAFDDLETLSIGDFDAQMEAFNAADLVIFSRDSNSGDYNDPLEQEAWTSGFTTPSIIMTPFVIRSSRWGMVGATAIADATNPMLAVQPDHPIFEGIELTDDTVDFWSQLGPDDAIDLVQDTEFGLAEIIAVEEATDFP